MWASDLKVTEGLGPLFFSDEPWSRSLRIVIFFFAWLLAAVVSAIRVFLSCSDLTSLEETYGPQIIVLKNAENIEQEAIGFP